jgi:hypothetical protein
VFHYIDTRKECPSEGWLQPAAAGRCRTLSDDNSCPPPTTNVCGNADRDPCGALLSFKNLPSDDNFGRTFLFSIPRQTDVYSIGEAHSFEFFLRKFRQAYLIEFEGRTP